jgi:hypothetical protein
MYRYDSQSGSWSNTHDAEHARAQTTFPHYSDHFERLRFTLLHFSIYDAWEGADVECPNCGWRGTLRKNGEWSEFGIESECDDCSQVLAYVAFPTHAEAVAAGDNSTVKMFEIMDSRTERFERTSLKTVDQLPEIDEQEFVLNWHTVERTETDRESYTLIQHNDHVIFRELAFFEGGFRYEPVARILKQKYGDRLKDVVPTHMGWLFLGGDSYSAMREAEDARQLLFGKPD